MRTIELQKVLTKQKELKELIKNIWREKIKEDFNKFFELKISDPIPDTVWEMFN